MCLNDGLQPKFSNIYKYIFVKVGRKFHLYMCYWIQEPCINIYIYINVKPKLMVVVQCNRNNWWKLLQYNLICENIWKTFI